ncbi:MAG: FHA domain-containing protein [Proteobacteria bacterium]|nr:FHA domain-containing protein [Pseudomonadota bacterium]
MLEARFHQDAISIGRDPAVDLKLDGDAVSGRHCAIEIFPAGEAFIRDLGSTNGTWVNGGQVSWARLRIGDRIRVGNHTLRFSTRATKAS